MKKILWVSRHQPLPSQEKELRRLFGEDCKIDLYPNAFHNASVVVSAYRKGYYDEMVLIAPLSVCKLITSYGIKPLHSEMVQADRNSSELTVRGTREKLENKERYYRFVKFKRMEGVEIVFSEIN